MRLSSSKPIPKDLNISKVWSRFRNQPKLHFNVVSCRTLVMNEKRQTHLKNFLNGWIISLFEVSNNK